MLLKKALLLVKNNLFSTSARNGIKVAVVGAAGGIGQPLALLLKQCPLITELSLHDISNCPGVAMDLSHINTETAVRGENGPENLEKALDCMDIVVIPAGLPRKPGMDRDELFKANASVVYDICTVIAKACPKALVAIITNPVNSAVPIAAEVLKQHGVFDQRRVFGVTTLDIVRANTFVGNKKGLDPHTVNVPVIGGHSGASIVPVLSQTLPKVSFSEEEVKALTKRIQDAGTEVVKAKAGKGSATLSMAFAAARFTFSLARGLKGENDIIECSYIKSEITEVNYFSTPLLLGKNGIEKNFGVPPLNDYEKELVKAAMGELKKNIQTGVDFVKNKSNKGQKKKE